MEEEDLRTLREALIRRKERLERELKRIEALISLVEEKLGARRAPPEEVKEVKPVTPPRRLALAVVGNKVVAEAVIHPDKLEILISEDFSVPLSSKPIYNFFVRRVLDAYSAEDAEKVSRGELDSKKALKYSLGQDEAGNLKKVVVVNYGDVARLNDILRKAKWAIQTVVKKTAGPSKE